MTKGAFEPLVPGMALRAGDLLAGRYRIEGRMRAKGGTILLAAHHRYSRMPVTVKILASYTEDQQHALERRVDRARLASRLRGPHCARVMDIGTTPEGMTYVVSEQLDGKTLDAELDDRGRMPVAEAVRYVLEACEALGEAHALGLVHGDLKPSNLFLARPLAANARARMKLDVEAPPVLKVLDFGMATIPDASSSTSFLGTPAYLAPEQIQGGTVDARTDVWALGVVLFELISGGLPFTSDTMSGVLVSIVYDAAPLLTDAPYELSKLVHRCLSKVPADRPSGVDELARELAPFAADGEKLSERVKVALTTPPADEPPPISSQRPKMSSIAPVAISVEPAPFEETTKPSLLRLEQRRRRTTGITAFALTTGALAVLVAAALSVTGPVVVKENAPDALDVAREVAAAAAVVAPAEAPAPAETASAAASASASATATAPPAAAAPAKKGSTPLRALLPPPHSRLPAGLPSTRVPTRDPWNTRK